MNPTQALISALERDLGGVAVVWCPDLGLREQLIDEVEGLARSRFRATGYRSRRRTGRRCWNSDEREARGGSDRYPVRRVRRRSAE